MDQDIVISKAVLSTIYCLFFFIVTSPVTKLGLIVLDYQRGKQSEPRKNSFRTSLSLPTCRETVHGSFLLFVCVAILFSFSFLYCFCTFVCLLSLFLNLTQSISFRLVDPAMIEFFSYPCLQLKVSSRGSHTFLGNCPPTPPLSQH